MTTTTCRILGPDDRLVFHLKGKPTTASRPRVARAGWAYYEKSYKEWRARQLKWLTVHEPHRIEQPVHVDMDVCVLRPKKPTRPYPRGDLDNYAKGPLDVMTKAEVWLDDNQVVELHVTKRYVTDPEEEGVVVRITLFKE